MQHAKMQDTSRRGIFQWPTLPCKCTTFPCKCTIEVLFQARLHVIYDRRDLASLDRVATSVTDVVDALSIPSTL